MTDDITSFNMAKGPALPSAMESEKKIEQDASKVIGVLKEHNATDLIDALGLRPYYVEEGV